jgi:alkaline phosphatase D
MRRRQLIVFIGIPVLLLFAWLYATRSEAPTGSQADPLPKKPGVFRIAFGSCNKQWKPNYMWKAILNCKPDLWIWLGDAVYAPTEDMTYLRQQYQLQKTKPEYQEFLKGVRVLGTWDDNDYGKKNGGKEYSKKVESQQIYLDFLDEPKDSPRRRQEGVYCSYLVGSAERQIKVILLDERYHRTEPGPDGDILGETQWAWLESELKQSTTAINLVCSSIQVLSSEQPYDKWADFPKSRERLLNLLHEARPRRLILISGDRHLGEISRLDDSGLEYPLYEITSSGLTHHVDFIYHLRSFFSPERNRYRVGSLFYEKNFGLVDVDWSLSSPVLSLQVRDQENRTRLQELIATSTQP